MQFIKPKTIGILKVDKMLAGNLIVINDIKNPTNKIIIQCRSKEHGEEIIKAIKEAKSGDKLYF